MMRMLAWSKLKGLGLAADAHAALADVFIGAEDSPGTSLWPPVRSTSTLRIFVAA
jgi:hypothetical protein